MKRLQPVIWMKGTFLSPQHLQAQDRFIESSLEFRMESLTANPWGFVTLQISREALAAGEFRISEASPMGYYSTSRLPSRRRPPYPWPALLRRTRIRSMST